MTKRVAMYGTYEATVKRLVGQRYWKRRADGVRQRYWKKVQRSTKVVVKGRYEFSGQGKDLLRAVILAHRIVPRDYVAVSAEKFLESPEEYGFKGEWIDREVES